MLFIALIICVQSETTSPPLNNESIPETPETIKQLQYRLGQLFEQGYQQDSLIEQRLTQHFLYINQGLKNLNEQLQQLQQD